MPIDDAMKRARRTNPPNPDNRWMKDGYERLYDETAPYLGAFGAELLRARIKNQADRQAVALSAPFAMQIYLDLDRESGRTMITGVVKDIEKPVLAYAIKKFRSDLSHLLAPDVIDHVDLSALMNRMPGVATIAENEMTLMSGGGGVDEYAPHPYIISYLSNHKYRPLITAATAAGISSSRIKVRATQSEYEAIEILLESAPTEDEIRKLASGLEPKFVEGACAELLDVKKILGEWLRG